MLVLQLNAESQPVVLALAGRVAISRNGIERELKAKHPRVLLALLATAPRHMVTRAKVIEALWGDQPPETWQTSLRVTVSKARAFLASEGLDAIVLESGTDGYRLTLAEGARVDIEEAGRQLEFAERALDASKPDAAYDAAAAARSVLAAPILPDAEGRWLDNLRRKTKHLLVRALEVQAEALTRLGQGAAAVRAAQEAVDLEPYQESAHRTLMRAHAAAGNKAEALRCYERCCLLLAEELGVDPAPATQALHLSILKDALAEPPGVAPPTEAEPLRAGKAALAKRRWEEAYAHLCRADALGPLAPVDLEALGEAALWSGRPGESLSARQRAHTAYLEAGHTRAAARVALAIASNHGLRGQFAVAEGWFRTAARLLEKEPPLPEHGQISLMAALMLFERGDLEASLANAERALEAGQRFAIPDLQALGILFKGLILARQDRLAEGLSLLDEAMAVATSGRLGPHATGLIYCRTVRTWLDLFEYRRAAEWIETIEQCAPRIDFGGNPGDCRAHLAEALVARGTWAEAQREAELACLAAEGYELSHVGLASYTLGEINLRRGDLEGAADAFQRAGEAGAPAQPGVALLQLARGDARQALASIKAWLEGISNRFQRARALPAAVEIGLAAGDLELASAAVQELDTIAGVYGSAALTAAAARAHGCLHLAQGESAAAVRDLRGAIDGYHAAELPYEQARARALLAKALLEQGDQVGADLEWQAARAVFSRLGAVSGLSLEDRRSGPAIPTSV